MESTCCTKCRHRYIILLLKKHRQAAIGLYYRRFPLPLLVRKTQQWHCWHLRAQEYLTFSDGKQSPYPLGQLPRYMRFQHLSGRLFLRLHNRHWLLSAKFLSRLKVSLTLPRKSIDDFASVKDIADSAKKGIDSLSCKKCQTPNTSGHQMY